MPSEDRAGSRLARSDPLVKTIRAMKRSAEERIHSGLMIAEGIRLAEEALAENIPITAAVTSAKLERDPRGRNLAGRLRQAGVEIKRADDALMRSLQDSESHQGILLLAPRPAFDVDDFTAPTGHASLLLVASGVQDPGNMGALVRLADAACADGLLALGGADPFGPKAVRASAGSVFRLAIARRQAIETSVISKLKSAGIRIAGAIVKGGRDYRTSDLSSPIAILLGGEGAGLPEELLGSIDLPITIPINPKVQSINVAAAAALLLFEASRSVSPAADSSRGSAEGRPRKTTRSSTSDPQGG